MTSDARTDSWLKSRNLPRLAFAVVFSAPVAGALLSLILGFTVMRNMIFFVQDPLNNSLLVPADFSQILINSMLVAVSGVMLGGLLGWPVMLAFGLPMHAALIRKTTAMAWHYAVGGLIAGLIAGFLRHTMQAGEATMGDLTLFLAIGGVAGAVAMLMFWLVRRPDRDAAEYKA